MFTRRNGGKLDLAQAADSVMHTHIRGGEISMIFQEPMTSLNPVFTVGTQVAEAVMLHQGLGHASAGRSPQDAGTGPHPRSQTGAETLSAPAFRRDAPARHDRDGPVLQADPAHRGRTDHGPRRDHSGADPPARPPVAGRDGHGGHFHHPRHGRRGRSGRPGARHVPRGGRGRGRVRTDFPQPRHYTHAAVLLAAVPGSAP